MVWPWEQPQTSADLMLMASSYCELVGEPNQVLPSAGRCVPDAASYQSCIVCLNLNVEHAAAITAGDSGQYSTAELKFFSRILSCIYAAILRDSQSSEPNFWDSTDSSMIHGRKVICESEALDDNPSNLNSCFDENLCVDDPSWSNEHGNCSVFSEGGALGPQHCSLTQALTTTLEQPWAASAPAEHLCLAVQFELWWKLKPCFAGAVLRGTS